MDFMDCDFARGCFRHKRHFVKILMKKGQILQQTFIHIIIIAVIAIIFMIFIFQRTNNRDIKQNLAERQTATLIDVASSGTEILIYKNNDNMYIDDVEIKNNRIYIAIDGLVSVSGYPIFSKYEISVEETDEEYIIIIK